MTFMSRLAVAILDWRPYPCKPCTADQAFMQQLLKDTGVWVLCGTPEQVGQGNHLLHMGSKDRAFRCTSVPRQCTPVVHCTLAANNPGGIPVREAHIWRKHQTRWSIILKRVDRANVRSSVTPNKCSDRF